MKLKGKIKELTALTSAICMLSVPNTTALAATGTKINSVPLSIESEIEAGDTDSDVTVSTSSSKFDIDDVVITNEPSDEWDDGAKPKLKNTLYADDDYRAKEAKEYYDGMTLADLNQRDKLRNDYYEHFTGIKRDDPKHYDMVVNVSKTGVEGAVAMILEYIKNKEKGE